ncbi:MAG: GAF domain-containing protein [Candidatus Marinimicrobia bacterium]|nr:GAF domain-containing protein [Candidatus Neomarinimicrobiota bacterium]
MHGSLPEVWLGVLLKIKNKIIGTICLQSYSNPETYSEKDIKLMEIISEQVALAIQYKRAEEGKEKLINDLQKALSDVKRLSGLIPICANCKKIRDDKGYWADVEKYISERSDVDFTHGICPDCTKKLYPDSIR